MPAPIATTVVAKNFKTIFIGAIFLLCFVVLITSCNKPSRVWNWNRTKINNRGDGNRIDWRNKVDKDDKKNVEDDQEPEEKTR